MSEIPNTATTTIDHAEAADAATWQSHGDVPSGRTRRSELVEALAERQMR